MSNSNHRFTLREIQPADGAAVARLIADFDGGMMTHFHMDAYTAIITGTKYHTVGVVVESPEYDGLVGMGAMRFSQVQYNGRLVPLAFLGNLKVHKDFRKRGLGNQLAEWRIQRARELYGEECVFVTTMDENNHASKAVARKWCKEIVDPAFEIRIMPVRRHPPKPMKGISVREISPNEYREFSKKQNRFFKDHNLYEPGDEASIQRLLGIMPEGKKTYRIFVAVDAAGNLLAGAQTWARGLMKSDQLIDPPLPVRFLNRFLHLLSPDFMIRDIAVSGLWHEPGQIRTAGFLWESIRWECRELGTGIFTGFSPNDPAGKIVKLKPWHQPRPKITLAIHASEPIDRHKPFFVVGRV